MQAVGQVQSCCVAVVPGASHLPTCRLPDLSCRPACRSKNQKKQKPQTKPSDTGRLSCVVAATVSLASIQSTFFSFFDRKKKRKQPPTPLGSLDAGAYSPPEPAAMPPDVVYVKLDAATRHAWIVPEGMVVWAMARAEHPGRTDAWRPEDVRRMVALCRSMIDADLAGENPSPLARGAHHDPQGRLLVDSYGFDRLLDGGLAGPAATLLPSAVAQAMTARIRALSRTPLRRLVMTLATDLERGGGNGGRATRSTTRHCGAAPSGRLCKIVVCEAPSRARPTHSTGPLSPGHRPPPRQLPVIGPSNGPISGGPLPFTPPTPLTLAAERTLSRASPSRIGPNSHVIMIPLRPPVVVRLSTQMLRANHHASGLMLGAATGPPTTRAREKRANETRAVSRMEPTGGLCSVAPTAMGPKPEGAQVRALRGPRRPLPASRCRPKCATTPAATWPPSTCSMTPWASGTCPRPRPPPAASCMYSVSAGGISRSAGSDPDALRLSCAPST